MSDHDAADDPCRITVLTTKGRLLLAKHYELEPMPGYPAGVVNLRGYNKAKMFSVASVRVQDIYDLHTVLCRLKGAATSCVVRGEPVEGVNRNHMPRLSAGKNPTLRDVPRYWAMLDIDKMPQPAGYDVLGDPRDAAGRVVDALVTHAPDLEDVTVVVDFSSGAGIREMAEAERASGLPARWNKAAALEGKAKVKAHVWVGLTEPRNSAQLKRWAEAVNAHAGYDVIDTNLMQAGQPHYTAAPVFGATLRDPLDGRRIHLIERDKQAASLTIPEKPARRPYAPAPVSGERREHSGGYATLLAKIGEPHGFNTPINSAIGSYIATNWPEPDIEALIAEVSARVLAADPGARPPAEIERYANYEQIRSRVTSIMGYEAAKREEAAAKRAARIKLVPTERVEPTYPDLGVSLAEGEAMIAAVVRDFVARLWGGQTPHFMIDVTVGTGKSFGAIADIPDMLAAGRARVGEHVPAMYLHPTHKLGDQIAKDIRRAHPKLCVRVWRGREAMNPDRPGEKMCTDPDLVEAAQRAGLGASHACQNCEKREGCSYILQGLLGQQERVDVWVIPQHALTNTPFAGWPRHMVDGKRVPVPPAFIIVDENPTQNWVAGLDPKHPRWIALSDIEKGPTDGEKMFADDKGNLSGYRGTFVSKIENELEGYVFRDALMAFKPRPPETMTIDDVRVPISAPIFPGKDWEKLEWKTKPVVLLPENPTRDQVMAAYEEAAKKGFKYIRPQIGRQVNNLFKTDDVRSVNIEKRPGTKEGESEIHLAWREDMHPAWGEPPVLYLGATTPHELLRYWSPNLEVFPVHVAAPHMRVTQIVDKEFGKTWGSKAQHAKHIANEILLRLAIAGGEALAVMQLAPERLVRAALKRRGAVHDPLPEGSKEDATTIWRFPSGAVLYLAHFGALEGSNDWQHVNTLMVFGRPAVDRQTGERWGDIISGKAVERFVEGNTDWPRRRAALRMADGTGYPIESQPYHPDPTVEAWRRSMCEGAVVQAIGRARGVRRTAAKPLSVFVYGNMALPETIHEVDEWEGTRPSKVDIAGAEAALFARALPLSAEGMTQARRDFWLTAEKAKDAKKYHGKVEREREGSKRGKTPISKKRASYRDFSPFAQQVRVGFTLRGDGGGNWSEALVPMEGGQEALEAIVGPVTGYRGPEPVSVTAPAAHFEVAVGHATVAPIIRNTRERFRVVCAMLAAIPPPPDLVGDARDRLCRDEWTRETQNALKAVRQQIEAEDG